MLILRSGDDFQIEDDSGMIVLKVKVADVLAVWEVFDADEHQSMCVCKSHDGKFIAMSVGCMGNGKATRLEAVVDLAAKLKPKRPKIEWRQEKDDKGNTCFLATASPETRFTICPIFRDDQIVWWVQKNGWAMDRNVTYASSEDAKAACEKEWDER